MQHRVLPLIDAGLRLLVRPGDWWHAKIPLSILLVLLLARDAAFGDLIPSLIALIFIVSCVGNYGFAINDLFDQEEDRLANKPNAATERGAGFVWAITIASGVMAVGVAGLLAGIWGAVLTVATLALPLIYSVPPIRTKERGWLGVLADAVAAHMFPAFLALMILARQGLHDPQPVLVAAIAVWSFLTGVRNILQHQIYSMESDLRAGLSTVVHEKGHAQLQATVMYKVLPPELIAFGAIIALTDPSPTLLVLIAIYLAIEVLKTAQNVVRIDIFTEQSKGFVPFANDGLYKVWGPVALAVDAGLTDPWYLILIPLLIAIFWERYFEEYKYLKHTAVRAWNDARRIRNRATGLFRRYVNLSRKHLRRGYNQTRGRVRRLNNKIRGEIRKRAKRSK